MLNWLANAVATRISHRLTAPITAAIAELKAEQDESRKRTRALINEVEDVLEKFSRVVAREGMRRSPVLTPPMTLPTFPRSRPPSAIIKPIIEPTPTEPLTPAQEYKAAQVMAVVERKQALARPSAGDSYSRIDAKVWKDGGEFMVLERTKGQTPQWQAAENENGKVLVPAELIEPDLRSVGTLFTSAETMSLLSSIARGVGGILKNPVAGTLLKGIPGIGTAIAVGSAAAGLYGAVKGGGGGGGGAPMIPAPPMPQLPVLTGGGYMPVAPQQMGMAGAGRAVGRIGGAIGRAVGKSKWIKSVAGGVVTWILVDALGNIISQRNTPPTRRMNPMNSKALRRANRRLESFEKAAKPIMRELGWSVKRSKSSCSCSPAKRKKC